MVALVVKLSEDDITYVPWNNIKLQVLAYFLIDLSSPNSEDMPEQWVLSVDKSSNLEGNRADMELEGLGELILEQYLFFNF